MSTRKPGSSKKNSDRWNKVIKTLFHENGEPKFELKADYEQILRNVHAVVEKEKSKSR